jgi:nitrate/nitrite-specific signal transduction histidine kinase
MDPNETLKMIRKIVNEWEDVGSSYMSHDELDTFTNELIEYVQSLDEWLTTGGFRPDDWS